MQINWIRNWIIYTFDLHVKLPEFSLESYFFPFFGIKV